jgi:hypothetical protein
LQDKLPRELSVLLENHLSLIAQERSGDTASRGDISVFILKAIIYNRNRDILSNNGACVLVESSFSFFAALVINGVKLTKVSEFFLWFGDGASMVFSNSCSFVSNHPNSCKESEPKATAKASQLE